MNYVYISEFRPLSGIPSLVDTVSSMVQTILVRESTLLKRFRAAKGARNLKVLTDWFHFILLFLRKG